MITFIVGENGAGKNALATYFLKEKYLREGQDILEKSRSLIRSLNEKFGRNLSLPEKVPFYTSNFRVMLHVGYNEYYEPYFLNGYYFGLENEKMDTEFVPPGSVIVFDEAQRIFNSRESASFPDFVSYAFEIHRHARLDITLLAQRGMLLDCNIREVGVHVIEVLGMENKKDLAGNIVRSIWHCREFNNWFDAEKCFKNGEKTYREKVYENQWDIFESYDSFDKIKEFMPSEGKDYSYLPHDLPDDVSAREKKFYQSSKPKGFRGK